MEKEAYFYTSQNSGGNLSTVNPGLKCVFLLRSKREEKLPNDDIPTSCCSKSIAAIISHVCPRCILGPALSAFFLEIGYKRIS